MGADMIPRSAEPRSYAEPTQRETCRCIMSALRKLGKIKNLGVSMRRSAFFALSVLLAVGAGAATIRRYSLDEVRDHSAAIFTGHVLSSSTRPVLEGRAITTDYLIEVDDLIHGVAGARTTVSYMNAGRNGAPALEQGTEYLFFRSE